METRTKVAACFHVSSKVQYKSECYNRLDSMSKVAERFVTLLACGGGSTEDLQQWLLATRLDSFPGLFFFLTHKINKRK